MRPPTIEEYWQRLENHDWFYVWANGARGYSDAITESKALYHMSLVSPVHAHLYTVYWTCMYVNMKIDDDDNVLNTVIPAHGKPEAA